MKRMFNTISSLLAVDPVHHVPYHQALRGKRPIWVGVLAIVAGAAAMGVILAVAIVPVGNVFEALRGAPPLDPKKPTLTPGLWVAGNLLLAALIPISMCIQWAFFGVHPRWLFSVSGTFRWGWLGKLSVVIVPIWMVYGVVLQLLQPSGTLRFTSTTVTLIALALVTIPLQSAGEEFLFRGLIQRSAGSWFHHEGLGLFVSTAVASVLFAAVHGSPDPYTLMYLLAAGIGFSLSTRFSGGVEASVLLHGMNNIVVLTPVLLAGQLESLKLTTGPVLILPTLVMLAAPFVVRWMAQRSVVKSHGDALGRDPAYAFTERGAK